MGVIVVTGAMMLCPFGTAPANLSVTSQSVVLAEGKAVATIHRMSISRGLACVLPSPIRRWRLRRLPRWVC